MKPGEIKTSFCTGDFTVSGCRRKGAAVMKIGVRAHDYGRMEIERLAEVLHNAGYQAAQLALPKEIGRASCRERV